MENIYTVASSSSSTTYGNVMTSFKEFLVRNFSANLFKDVHLSSEIAYSNIRRRLGRNTLKELSKLERPFMNITPQIQAPSGDAYLYDIPLTKNIHSIEHGIMTKTLFPVLINTTDGYRLNYKLNRDQIQFDMTIVVETSIQQLDLYKYMLNHFTWDNPFIIETSMEAMIPREMIRCMGNLSNIDIDDEKNNQIPAMLYMLNQTSQFPITYKMRNGTACDEFFMYYNAKLLVTLTDLTPEPVSRRGMTDDYYTITFHAAVEFNLPGMFILTGEKPRPENLSDVLKESSEDESYDLIPLYTINNFYSRYTSIKNGFMLYISSRFQTETNPETHIDTLNLSILFDQPYLKAIDEYHAAGNPMDTLIEIILVRDDEELTSGEEWKVNWNSRDLTILHPDDQATYTIVIYINNNLFNEYISEDYESRKIDKSTI